MCDAAPVGSDGKQSDMYKGCEDLGPKGEAGRPWDVCVDKEGVHFGNPWGHLGDAKNAIKVNKNFGVEPDKLCSSVDRYKKTPSCPASQQTILSN